MCRKILNDPLKFPDEMGMRLLSGDPENRLGFNDAKEIKQHPFFKSSTPLGFCVIARSTEGTRKIGSLSFIRRE